MRNEFFQFGRISIFYVQTFLSNDFISSLIDFSESFLLYPQAPFLFFHP
jgi:hypothetical protein